MPLPAMNLLAHSCCEGGQEDGSAGDRDANGQGEPSTPERRKVLSGPRRGESLRHTSAAGPTARPRGRPGRRRRGAQGSSWRDAGDGEGSERRRRAIGFSWERPAEVGGEQTGDGTTEKQRRRGRVLFICSAMGLAPQASPQPSCAAVPPLKSQWRCEADTPGPPAGRRHGACLSWVLTAAHCSSSEAAAPGWKESGRAGVDGPSGATDRAGSTTDRSAVVRRLGARVRFVVPDPAQLDVSQPEVLARPTAATEFADGHGDWPVTGPEWLTFR